MNSHGGRFDGKRVLITGGTGGIGRALALAFATEGAMVIATGRDRTEVDDFTVSLVGHPCARHITPAELDVTDGAAVTALIEPLDRLDCLINGAGILLRQGAEYEIERFQHVLNVNLTGTMRVCQAARPLLADVGGCVVNVASMWSIFGGGAVPAYTASKGGVAQLTKALAVAWAPEGIRVNAIAPGWIETGMTHALLNDPERMRAITQRTPLGRWGKPDDVTGPTLFLCSPAAAFITGIIMPVDGGYSAM